MVSQTITLDQLYIMGSDGSNQRLISDGTGSDRYADVYGNGQRLLFLRVIQVVTPQARLRLKRSECGIFR